MCEAALRPRAGARPRNGPPGPRGLHRSQGRHGSALTSGVIGPGLRIPPKEARPTRSGPPSGPGLTRAHPPARVKPPPNRPGYLRAAFGFLTLGGSVLTWVSARSTQLAATSGVARQAAGRLMYPPIGRSAGPNG